MQVFHCSYLVLPLLLGDLAYHPDPDYPFHQQVHFHQGIQQHLWIKKDHSIIFILLFCTGKKDHLNFFYKKNDECSYFKDRGNHLVYKHLSKAEYLLYWVHWNSVDLELPLFPPFSLLTWNLWCWKSIQATCFLSLPLLQNQVFWE